MAERGDANAQTTLGMMYDNGRGVAQDYIQAHTWFNLASAKAMSGPMWKDIAKSRGLIAENMTPAQIAEAQRFAREWLATHGD